ncbi:MAG: DUF4172 domain-containing protein [Deltaproteobacteria bacterium]|nr:DUF4172 domain-containing protein [Deltaproteobacteria bacterium]
MDFDPKDLIFNQPDWPKFKWDDEALANDLALLAAEEKLLTNKLSLIEPIFLAELKRVTLFEDLTSSFSLDDEFLDPEAVAAVLADKSLDFSQALTRLTIGDLWLATAEETFLNNYANLLLDAKANPLRLLTPKKLNRWRKALTRPLTVAGLGSYRVEAYGPCPPRPGAKPFAQENLPAPLATDAPKEMSRFFAFLSAPFEPDLAIKAALSHLWFLIVEPYLAVSGRLGRLTADLILGAKGNEAHRYYSLAKAINADRRTYLKLFKATLFKPSLDVTLWISWQIKLILKAIKAASERLDLVINKAVAFNQTPDSGLSQDQKNVLAILAADFVGPLTRQRYAKITSLEPALAEKEFSELVARDLIAPKFLTWPANGPQPSRQDLGL